MHYSREARSPGKRSIVTALSSRLRPKVLLTAAVSIGMSTAACHSIPGPYSPLGSVAPCWAPNSTKRHEAVQSWPLKDPLGARGYVPESAFRWDEYCQHSWGSGKVDASEVEVKDCIIEQCRFSLGTWKSRERSRKTTTLGYPHEIRAGNAFYGCANVLGWRHRLPNLMACDINCRSRFSSLSNFVTTFAVTRFFVFIFADQEEQKS